MKGHTGTKSIAYSFFNLSPWWKWVVNITPGQITLLEQIQRVYIVQEVRWGPGPLWTSTEYLTPNRNSIPGPSSS